MKWVIEHWDTVALIAAGVISEAIAIRQQLKFPENDGVGSILGALLKVFAKKPVA